MTLSSAGISRSTASVYLRAMKMSLRTGNLGDPSPVTGSQPGAARKPVSELHPGLLPTVMSLKASGWAYCGVLVYIYQRLILVGSDVQ